MALGARRAFVDPAAFHGAVLRVPSNSALTSAILAALGTRAASIASGPDLISALKSGTVDGAVTSPLWILRNGYYGAAKYLTTNLIFFPLVGSVAINEHAFETLTPTERSILRKAAAEMTRTSFVGIRARDQLQLRLACLSGLKVATARTSQLSALRRAEQRVYTDLEADRATAARIATIQALKKETKPTSPVRTPTGCAA